MTPLKRIADRVNRHGDVNDPATIRPLLTLPEFFDGNDDFGSIGCNLAPPPGPVKFYEILKGISERSDVADVRVQITMFDRSRTIAGRNAGRGMLVGLNKGEQYRAPKSRIRRLLPWIVSLQRLDDDGRSSLENHTCR